MRESRAVQLAKVGAAVLKKDESELTPTLLALKERLELAFQLLITGDQSDEAVQQHLCAHFNLSVMDALEDMRDCKALWGDVTRGHRVMDQSVAFRRAEKSYFEALNILDDAVSPSQRAMAVDMMLKATSLMARIKGVDKEEVQRIDPSLLEASTYQLQLSPRAAQLMEAMANSGSDRIAALVKTGGGKLDFAQLFDGLPDAPFVEVPDALPPKSST